MKFMDQFSTQRKLFETVRLSGHKLTGINEFANFAEPDKNSNLCVSHSTRDLELICEVINEICAVMEGKFMQWCKVNLCSDERQIFAVIGSKSVRRWKANFCSDGRQTFAVMECTFVQKWKANFCSDGKQIYAVMESKSVRRWKENFCSDGRQIYAVIEGTFLQFWRQICTVINFLLLFRKYKMCLRFSEYE